VREVHPFAYYQPPKVSAAKFCARVRDIHGFWRTSQRRSRRACCHRRAAGG